MQQEDAHVCVSQLYLNCKKKRSTIKIIFKLQSGSCHGHTERWYFDSQMGTCQSFSYTGCRGNRNNFADRQRCEDACVDSSQNNNQNQGNYNNRPQYSWTDGNMNQQYHTSYSPSNEDSRYNRFPALNLELEQPEEEIPMR